ncbi:MAG: hypothetical protein FWF05_00965 [Oscillospiraceae bacterium]|nr:hypothetical protein [Oscillospiraceae bacterium]
MKRTYEKLLAAMLAAVMLFTAVLGGGTPAMAEGDGNGAGPEEAITAASSEALTGPDRTGIADRVIISVFFPPLQPPHGPGINDYHYRMMAECGINFIENVASAGMQSREENLRIAELCDKYGMWLFVSEMNEWWPAIKDTRQPWNYQLDLTQTQLEDYVNYWKDIPGVGGFFLYDEADTSGAYSIANYGALIGKIKKLAPDLILHTSDAPNRSTAEFTRLITSALDASDNLYTPDHMGDCEYPFQSGVNGDIKYTWYKYLDNYRKIGLEYGVKTSRYLQLAAGWDGPVSNSRYKVMEKNQIRYELYSGLAYGVKKFSLFTWNRPQGGDWAGCVIDRDGNFTPMYDHLKDLFGQVHALSDVVFPLEAHNVYSTVDKRGGFLNLEKYTAKPPGNFPAQPGDTRDVLYSDMVNPNDGTRYLMVVNNQTHSNHSAITHTVNFKNAEGLKIAALTEVSHETGEYLEPIDLTGAHSASISLLPGEGRLFRLDYASGSEPGGDNGGDAPDLTWLWGILGVGGALAVGVGALTVGLSFLGLLVVLVMAIVGAIVIPLTIPASRNWIFELLGL